MFMSINVIKMFYEKSTKNRYDFYPLNVRVSKKYQIYISSFLISYEYGINFICMLIGFKDTYGDKKYQNAVFTRFLPKGADFQKSTRHLSDQSVIQ